MPRPAALSRSYRREKIQIFAGEMRKWTRQTHAEGLGQVLKSLGIWRDKSANLVWPQCAYLECSLLAFVHKFEHNIRALCSSFWMGNSYPRSSWRNCKLLLIKMNILLCVFYRVYAQWIMIELFSNSIY